MTHSTTKYIMVINWRMETYITKIWKEKSHKYSTIYLDNGWTRIRSTSEVLVEHQREDQSI